MGGHRGIPVHQPCLRGAAIIQLRSDFVRDAESSEFQGKKKKKLQPLKYWIKIFKPISGYEHIRDF